MRILDAETVAELIDEATVLDSIRELFTTQGSAGEVGYARVDLDHPAGWLRALPAYVVPQDLLGFKVLHRTEGVGMRYTIYVHRLGTGELVGVVDGLEVTNLRTGAVSAVATEHLASPEVPAAAIIGTGPVARGQLRALELVRPAEEIRVFARTEENRNVFVDEMAPHVSGRLIATATLEAAVEGASIVTLATKASAPVLTAAHLRPGVHVNSVGPASRDRVEVDPGIFKSFDLVVCDSVDLVLDEAGDAYQAVLAHGLDADRVTELSDVVSGRAPGRVDRDQMTLFKSVGTGAQDLVVASLLLDRATAMGMGTVVADLSSVKPLPLPR